MDSKSPWAYAEIQQIVRFIGLFCNDIYKCSVLISNAVNNDMCLLYILYVQLLYHILLHQ